MSRKINKKKIIMFYRSLKEKRALTEAEIDGEERKALLKAFHKSYQSLWEYDRDNDSIVNIMMEDLRHCPEILIHSRKKGGLNHGYLSSI